MKSTEKRVQVTPDAGKNIHVQGAIKQLRQFFKDHLNGLPELIKNCSDEYSRRHFPEDQRVICVLLQAPRGANRGSLSVLDFGGMTSETLEKKLSVWADPDASRGDDGTETQGGKGNGGKAYLAEMFSQGALIRTVRDGLGCAYGIEAGEYRFGYSPNPATGRNQPVNDVDAVLDAYLHDVGFALDQLPREARQALRKSNGFTLVSGFGPKDVQRIRSKSWRETLCDHDQMEISIDLCDIYLLVGGRVVSGGAFRVPAIESLPGAEARRVIEIPETLTDPLSGESVSTTEKGKLPAGTLEMYTSKSSLRKSKKGNIKFRAAGHGHYGSEPVAGMGVTSQWRDKIYGTCFIDSAAALALNDRGALADSQLKRALLAWIGDEIQKYAEEFELRDKRAASQREKDELSRLNEVLDEWKNDLLRAEVDDFIGTGGGVGGSGGGGTHNPLPVGKPVRIDVKQMPGYSGAGVWIKPKVEFFDIDGVRIRPTAYRWVSSDGTVVDTDEDLLILATCKPGFAEVHAQTYDGLAKSSPSTIEVLDLQQIDLDPTTVEVPVNGRRFVKAMCATKDGRIMDSVALNWESANENVALTTPSGSVSGVAVGQTTVLACDDSVRSRIDTAIQVVPPRNDDNGGKRFPRILVSGVDLDPDHNNDVILLDDQPPVVQRPEDIDRQIWWINSNAPLARMLIDNLTVNSTAWRLYHVDRYIEALTQVFLRIENQMDLEQTGELWVQDVGIKASEVQAHAARTLLRFIDSGGAPEDET